MAYRPLFIKTPEQLLLLRHKFSLELATLSKLSYSIVMSIRGSSSLTARFFESLFLIKRQDIRRYPNTTEETAVEILSFIDRLIQFALGDENALHLQKSDSNCEIMPYILSQLEPLSARARNQVLMILTESDFNTNAFLDRISSPDYEKYLTFRVGKKTALEIRGFITSVLSYRQSSDSSNASTVGENNNSSEVCTKQQVEGKNEPDIKSEFQKRLNQLSKRTSNAVKRYIKENGLDIESFLNDICTASFNPFDIAGLGKRGVSELMSIVHIIQVGQAHIQPEQEEANRCFPKSVDTPLPSMIENYEPLFLHRASSLSRRANKALMSLYDECGKSMALLYEEITSPEFSLSRLHFNNCGAATLKELIPFLRDILTEIERIAISEDVDFIYNELFNSKIQAFVASETDVAAISKWSIEHHTFPYFKVIDTIIQNLPDQEKDILINCLHIYEGERGKSMRDIARERGCSVERIRQMRNNCTLDLIKRFRKLHSVFPHNCSYPLLVPSVSEMINQKEGVSFTEIFTIWAISTLFPGYSLVGNSLHIPSWKSEQLSLFPNSLKKLFQIDKFIDSISSLVEDKRYRDTYFSLQELITPFLLHGHQYAEINLSTDLESWCQYVLMHQFKLYPENGIICLKANTIMPVSEFAYELIKNNGRSLSGEVIILEYKTAYSERKLSAVSVLAQVRKDPRILCMGRSGNYTLAEWKESEHRGGTIRDFVNEYLNSLDEPIALLDDITDYVKRFRPTTSAKSILYNLQLDSEKKYSVYLKDGQKYISFSTYQCSPKLIPYSSTFTPRRSFEESLSALEEFIAHHSRFPTLRKDVTEEEKRLARFVDTQRLYLRNNTLQKDNKDRWLCFEKEYSQYK